MRVRRRSRAPPTPGGSALDGASRDRSRQPPEQRAAQYVRECDETERDRDEPRVELAVLGDPVLLELGPLERVDLVVDQREALAVLGPEVLAVRLVRDL